MAMSLSLPIQIPPMLLHAAAGLTLTAVAHFLHVVVGLVSPSSRAR